MRLDMFLPYQRKPSRLRRTLGRIGATWTSSPVRRLFQAACFLLFLAMFFYGCWPYGGADYIQTHKSRNLIPAESFLNIDPLVSISTALAAKAWVFSLTWAGVLLLVCALIPRGFCGYICPLGTLIDLFDWTIGKRIKRFRVERDGWWVHLKYYLLLGTLISSLLGILVSGFVAAIPVLTRGLLFLLGPVEMGGLKGWYLVPAMNAGHWFSIALFLVVLALGLLRPRFWCRYVCPSGAVFSIFNFLRVSERKVETTCIDCDKCRRICPFDAIDPGNFTTRTADCTLCQTCAGVCPTHSIKFVGRSDAGDARSVADAAGQIALSRRGLLTGVAAGAVVAAGIGKVRGAVSLPIVRPPGSVPEADFLQLCIRCGECFKVCPNNVLQPMGFGQGLNNLWTPQVVANWSGCEPSCNNCGQVCPTGAIHPLPIAEKRVIRMGLAIVNERTCLPFAGREACQMCFDECAAAGYNAIEFRRVGVQMDDSGAPVEGSGLVCPVVLPDKCVGCGLCQTRCHVINVKQKHLLAVTAIEVVAGAGHEDRLPAGYRAPTTPKHREPSTAPPAPTTQGGGDYLPDFLK